MVGFIILIAYFILLILSFNKINSPTLKLNLIAISTPWVFYFSIIYLFQVKFYNFNINFFIIILILSMLSYFSCISGYNNTIKKNNINKSHKFRYFNEYYNFAIILGIIGASATIFGRLENLGDFLNYSNPEEIYKLRYSANLSDAGLRIENNIEYLKIFYPFSFISIVAVGGSLINKFLRYICLVLFIVGALMVAGRFNILYAVLSLIITVYFNNKNILNLKNFFIILIFAYFLAFTFNLRSPDFDSLNFYKRVANISDISFLGIANLEGKYITPIYNIITYYVQSANHLTKFLSDYDLRDYTYGGYQFEIVFNIINKILGTSFVTKRELSIYDPSFGLFSTYTRDLLSDFGYLNCIFFSILTGYFLGVFAVRKDEHWIYRTIYHYLIIQFILAPMVLIYVDFILLNHIYLLAILFFKQKKI